jgi:hypothetical protein
VLWKVKYLLSIEFEIKSTEGIMKIFEIFMLLCFGFAWPTSIYKSIKSKSVEGKSVVFLYVIIAGYLFGILHKIVNDPDFVIFFYALNAVMVFIDLLLYYKNKKLAKLQENRVIV